MQRTRRVYLDHAATTPVRPCALEAYAEAAREAGNAASQHAHGQAAMRRLAAATERIAEALGCDAAELVLTSGGTESINLAVKGLYLARRRADPAARAILSTPAEHHATLETIAWLAREHGAVPRWAEVDEGAVLRPERLPGLAAAGDVAVASVLHANNETGALQPVREIAAICREHGVPVHVDAVASFGAEPVSMRAWGVDALSVSAHKIGGPGGIGALAVRRGLEPEALLHGGAAQRGLRPGTRDVAAAVAFAAAVEEAERERSAARERTAALRERLLAGVRSAVPDAVLRGPEPDGVLDDAGSRGPARLAGNVLLTFPGCQGDSLLLLLDMAGVSVSTGAACQAGVAEPSHVLLAAGLDERTALGALRVTLGRDTSEGDVDRFLHALPGAVERARRAGFSDRPAGRGSAA